MNTPVTEENSGDRRLVEREVFKDVIGHFASGVTVITTRENEIDLGITASAVSCLSLDPPMLLVCIHKKSYTCHAIAKTKVFGVNILHEDQGDVAIRFATANSDKFQGVDIAYGELSVPLLQGVLANLECRVVEEVTGGTHSVFLAEVQNASAVEGAPLAYFKGKFGRFQLANDEMVYRRIRTLILERNLQVGETLNISELTLQLELPRQAVYYALTRLDAEGLITREEGGDYTVNPLDAETLNEALETRCALEIAAAERTVGKLSHDEITELKKRMNETFAQMEGNSLSVDRYIEANTMFHDFIVALAKNTTLLETYRRLTAEAVMSSALRVALEANNKTAYDELDALSRDHESLTKAYVEGDLEEAKRIIRWHTEGAKRLGRYLIDRAGGRI